MFKNNEKLTMKNEQFKDKIAMIFENAFFFVVFRCGFLKFQLTEPCSVAGHDSIPNPIRWESGNLRGKEDVGLGDLKTERNMC
ncbi:MAG: hypothetical protein PHH75_04645 [Candidatus Omnitrophica bacterium]|nr:hypothetical protein [Candidatus Omnitrophota bacterium]MDD5574449.1 hypothetical protein [Candidatus Omnitrophota bacterium]